jgi:hypothetical protein
MSETKEEIAAQRDQLIAERDALVLEVAGLRDQLAGARPPAAEHQFVLSEGVRQELTTYGAAVVDGKLLTRDQVLERLGPDQAAVDIPPPAPDLVRPLPVVRPAGATPGVDFVYPSVEPGGIDPAVAGTPGIYGPAAAE